MKILPALIIAAFISTGISDRAFYLPGNFAFAKKGSGKEGDGRSESDRSGQGSGSDDRRRRSDSGGRDERGSSGSSSGSSGGGHSGYGRGGDIVDVVERTLELDNDGDRVNNSGPGNAGDLQAPASQTSPAPAGKVSLHGDNFERF